MRLPNNGSVGSSIASEKATFPLAGAARSPGRSSRSLPDDCAREIYFPPRTLIFLEGDEIGSIFEVLDGVVMLYKLLPDGRRQVVELLRAGDIFGFSPFPVRCCSAESLTPTRCTARDRVSIERSPLLAQALNARLYAQLCALQEHAMLLGRKTAIERIASFLIRCIPGRGEYDCTGPQDPDDQVDIRLTMTRQEIADYLGLTIETVSRLMSRLKRRGVLTIDRLDEIHVRDVCRLCRLTGRHLTRDPWCGAHAMTRTPSFRSETVAAR